jgi:hypothetical protein
MNIGKRYTTIGSMAKMKDAYKTIFLPNGKKQFTNIMKKTLNFGWDYQDMDIDKIPHWKVVLRAVQIRVALLTRTGSESETESDTGDVSLGAGSTWKVETRGEDLSLS